MVRFRCIRSNGNARKRHETGNGNTGYPSCFQNGLTCFCHVSVYGFLQFRPVKVVSLSLIRFKGKTKESYLMRFQFTYLIFFQNHSSTLFVPAATWDSYQLLGYSQVSLSAVLLLVFCQTSLEGGGLSSSVAFSAGCSILFPHLLQRFGFFALCRSIVGFMLGTLHLLLVACHC